MTSFRGRGSTYAALAGLASGMLLTGLVLPYAVGERPEGAATTAEVAAELPGPADDVSGTDALPGAATAAGPSSESAAPAAGLAEGGSSGPSASGAPAPGERSAVGSAAPRAGKEDLRAASDVGVTPEEIRLGFILINVGPANDLGTVVGIEVEQQRRAIEILTARVNDRGGIHGRRIRPVFAVWDVLDGSSGRRACLSLTEDSKAFAVIGPVNPPDVPCYTREHGTALLWNCQACPDSSFDRSPGLILSGSMRSTAHVRAWIAELDRVDYLKASKIGIVTDETNDPGAEMAGQLSAVLRRTDRQVVRVSRLSADLSTGSSQIPVEVSQMRSAGAEAVLFLGNRLYATQFVQQADSQRWRPLWSTSEAGSLNVDTCCENMPRSFEGTLGLNTNYDGGQPEHPASRACRETHDAEAPEPLDDRGTNEYNLTMGVCDYIAMFERAARAAGVGLTRSRLVAAAQAIGPLGPLAGSMGGRFAPGKVDLEDFARLQVWRADCRCWRGAGPFRRVR